MKPKDNTLPCGRSVPKSFGPHPILISDLFKLSKRKMDSYVVMKKLKQSRSRLRVLEILLNFKSHFTSLQLIEEVSKTDPNIGSATVYRALLLFVQAGVLNETFSVDKGEKIYEIEKGTHHDHIVCSDCGTIIEFCDPKIERIQQRVLKELKFQQIKHQHVIYARCEYLD